MNSPGPRVIVHADAFGCAPMFNEGVERGHRFGIVSSASLAAAGDVLEDAVRRSRSLPALDLGLHFLLLDTRGRPLALPRLARACVSGELSSREIAGRLRSQLDLLLRVYRLSLSHIVLDPDLDCFAPLMRVVSAVAMEYGIPGVRQRTEQRPWLRLPARAARRQLTAYRRRAPAVCLDRQGRLTPISLTDALRSAGPGVTEIICRPGTVPLPRRAPDAGGNWEGDLQAVCDDSARACVRLGRVALATWRDV